MSCLTATAEELFSQYFWPLYPEEAQKDLAGARTTDRNPGRNPAIDAHLDEAAAIFAARAKDLFGEDLQLDFSDASVHRLSAALTPARRDAWSAKGTPGTPENELFNVVVHGAAYVGACIVHHARRDAEWSVRSPLWESVVVLRSPAGEANLAIFQWFLKSLTGDRETLADRYRTYVEVPTFDADALPVLVPADRKLPRIVKNVRYDVLYKHLKAHLPELRDLGKDFPSPERFAELDLRWLDFLLLGGGRMLLMYGLGAAGLHLFWLDASGFQKASFVPAEKFPEPVVKVASDGTLALVVSHEGNVVTHRMLWWGM
jgi:hypothetical protein